MIGISSIISILQFQCADLKMKMCPVDVLEMRPPEFSHQIIQLLNWGPTMFQALSGLSWYKSEQNSQKMCIGQSGK